MWEGVLECEHVSWQGKLTCENISMQGMMMHKARKNSRRVGT